MEGYLSDPEMERHLRDRYFTIRNERYVLPMLASARSAVPGIVHNASQSGQTLFVEPDGMVELGNELAIANATAAEEEARILRELSGAVTGRAAALARGLAVLAELDALEGAARLASDLDAHAPGALRRARRLRAALAAPPAAGAAGQEGGGQPRPPGRPGAGAHRLGAERRRQDRGHHARSGSRR